MIVVTGAGGDLGSTVYKELARTNEVVPAYRGDCNVTDQRSVRAFMEKASEPKGRIDGLVCAHGAPGIVGPSETLSDEAFLNLLNIDLLGAFRCCQAVRPYMEEQGGGSIVIVSSMHAIATYPQRTAYAAAKAGVMGMVKALAIEWASQGIRVNAVLPWQIEGTRRTAGLDHETLKRVSPSGRVVSKQAVVKAVQYLLDSSPGVTGHGLVVDEGVMSSAWPGGYA